MNDYLTTKVAWHRASGSLPAAPSSAAAAKPLIVWQPVSAHEYVGACRYTGYVDKTIRLTLACGHEQYRKASQGAPLKARCRDCERASLAISSQDRP
jgi:hypothetical protein